VSFKGSFVVYLVFQLLLQLSVHEQLLPSVLIVNLVDHISSLLRTKVGLVVLLVNIMLYTPDNLVSSYLLLDQILVSFHVAPVVQACF